MREVLEEGEELDDVVLLDDLDPDVGCGPLFVDGDDGAAARDLEGRGEAIEISETKMMKRAIDLPVKFDVEAGHGELECMQISE